MVHRSSQLDYINVAFTPDHKFISQLKLTELEILKFGYRNIKIKCSFFLFYSFTAIQSAIEFFGGMYENAFVPKYFNKSVCRVENVVA